MNSSSSVFRTAAIGSGLVTGDQLRAAEDRIASSSDGKTRTQVSDKQLASELVKMKLLTPYQADQLLTGRKKLNLGPYIITDWIGQGGMGQVFKAVHEMLGRECAIKVLPLHKTTPEAIANFRREIRAQAKLDHPNLVRAYDAGEDGNVHYLVVEYVPGTDLRRLVRTKGKLSVQQAANIILQAAMGLDHAHQRGLIHRDIKPGNILVTPEGVAKLSDLGLAFYLNDPNDPRIGKIVGTADYLSPEQIRTPLDVTIASDIYSLGCTLYYAVTGKVPFPGGTPKSKARRHLEETPWHPRRFNEEVTDEFADLIGDMMEKEPSKRIQSAAEVAERLAPWASDDSPLLSEDMERSRWMPAPIVEDDQATDPNDIAEMAMDELGSGARSVGGYYETLDTGSISNTSEIVPSGVSRPPSISGQYRSAPHLPKDVPSVSVQVFFLGTVVALAIGVLVGFVCGYLFPR